jgi:hypothetical protein
MNVTDASHNTIIGNSSGSNISSATFNTSLGASVFEDLTSGTANVAIGQTALAQVSTGGNNTALGTASLTDLGTGSYNTCLGSNAGSNYATTESSNICIGYSTSGTAAENHVLRIGNGTGTSNGNLSAAYISGIDGVNVGSVARVVTEASNQLGTAVITAGTGITITPSANVITISATGTTTLNYTAVSHAATPYTVLSTDDYIGVNTSGGVVSILLPNAPATGRVVIVKDSNGTSSTSNVTVTTVGGAVTIDGATTFIMNTAYESAQFIFNGTSYEVF